MDIETVNELVLEHLRYHGLPLAARIMENETRSKKLRRPDRASRLFGEE
jgi:hypothetical protein